MDRKEDLVREVLDWRVASRLLLAIILILGLFSAVASAAILLLTCMGTVPIGIAGALARITLFGGVAVAASAAVVRLRRSTLGEEALLNPSAARSLRGEPRWMILFFLFLYVLVAFPRLDAYPWIAPDEAHHLAVARNLAAFHVYGSGLPQTGFRWFDNYNSVGAPAIMPVAAAMALAGSDPATPRTIAAARITMALCSGILYMLAYLLLVPSFGAAAATAGVLVMLAMPGSVYLARTLYGEAPALMWLASGLLAWRRPGRVVPGLMAGACFGLAVLCKSIVILAVFPFLGVMCFEFMTERRVRLIEWAMPPVGGLAVVAAWWIAQMLFKYDVTTAVGGTLAEYQHNLLFGVRCLARTVPVLWHQPFAWCATLAGLATMAATLAARRYDRSLAVLFMIAVFYLYWWLFFTPGHILRYLWFSQAIGGLFVGVAAWQACGAIRRASPFLRVLLAILVISVAALLFTRLADAIIPVWTADEMSSDYQVAARVRNLPQSAMICTVDKPLAWTLNLLAARQVKVVENLAAEAPPGVWTIVKKGDRVFHLSPPKKTE